MLTSYFYHNNTTHKFPTHTEIYLEYRTLIIITMKTPSIPPHDGQ